MPAELAPGYGFVGGEMIHLMNQRRGIYMPAETTRKWLRECIVPIAPVIGKQLNSEIRCSTARYQMRP